MQLKKIIVAGCSFTHGAELDHPYMSKRNVELSYSQYIADQLGCKNHNIAMSACSNDWIFHRTMDAIQQGGNIHSVIVCWTYSARMTWRCDGTIYNLHPTMFCAHKDPMNFEKFYDGDAPEGTLIRAETQQHADELSNMHPYMIRNFMDHAEKEENRKRYSQALQAFCKLPRNNIPLYQTHAQNYTDIGTFDAEGRHPNAEEHVAIGKRIMDQFYG